jgi:hypothetical protein
MSSWGQDRTTKDRTSEGPKKPDKNVRGRYRHEFFGNRDWFSSLHHRHCRLDIVVMVCSTFTVSAALNVYHPAGE